MLDTCYVHTNLTDCESSLETKKIDSKSSIPICKRNSSTVHPCISRLRPQGTRALRPNLSALKASRPSSSWCKLRSFLRSCICGQEQSCQKTIAAALRPFRRDCMGRIPVELTDADFPLEDDDLWRLPDMIGEAAGPARGYDYAGDLDQPVYRLPRSRNRNSGSNYYDDSRIGSRETGGTRQDPNFGIRWSRILYWELRERKGRPYDAVEDYVNIIGDTPIGSGLSLGSIFNNESSYTNDPQILRTRRKIGQGMVIWKADEQIWVYNRSDTTLYLNSATLDNSLDDLKIYRCPAGYAMVIYHYQTARELQIEADAYLDQQRRLRFREHLSQANVVPEDFRDVSKDKADVHSIRISFAKCWGRGYHRRDILCCPCWIEVHVESVGSDAPPR